MKGRVVKFDDRLGYGFIFPEAGGRDVFVHHTGIEGTGHRTLNEGDEVEFEVIQGPKGPQAEHVCRITA